MSPKKVLNIQVICYQIPSSFMWPYRVSKTICFMDMESSIAIKMNIHQETENLRYSERLSVI